MAALILNSAHLNGTLNQLELPELDASRTLVLVPGYRGSSEEEPIQSQDDETNAIRGLIAQARKAKIPIVLLHVGGRGSRGIERGPASNHVDDANRVAADAADVMVVIQPGDYDHFFTDLAVKRGVPISVVSDVGSAIAAVEKLFRH